MKRSIIFIFFLTLQFYVVGQQKIIREIYLGTSHGVNFSSVIFNPRENLSLLPGYYGEFHIIYKAQKVVGVKLGFNYVQKGWQLALDSTESYKRNLNYYEIPFTTHVMLGKNKFKYLIDIGPYISYLSSEKEKNNLNTTEKDFSGLKIHNEFDFGACLGTGFQYETPIGRIGLSLKYTIGLTSIFTPSESLEYFSSHNQSISVGLIYTIKII